MGHYGEIMNAKKYHCLYSPEEKKYWSGNLPYGTKPYGRSGKMAAGIQRWKPRMSETAPKAASWARLSSATDRLATYEALRVVRPDVPELVVQTIEMIATVTAETPPEPLTTRRRAKHLMMFHFGVETAEAFERLDVFGHPQHRYMVRCSYSEGRLSPGKVLRHIPEALNRGQTVFLREDDLVMLRMIAPKANYFDLGKVLSGEFEFEQDR